MTRCKLVMLVVAIALTFVCGIMVGRRLERNAQSWVERSALVLPLGKSSSKPVRETDPWGGPINPWSE